MSVADFSNDMNPKVTQESKNFPPILGTIFNSILLGASFGSINSEVVVSSNLIYEVKTEARPHDSENIQESSMDDFSLQMQMKLLELS